MKTRFLFLLFYLFTLSNSVTAQDKVDSKRGTIKVKKSAPIRYFISAKTNSKKKLEARVFRGRYYNYDYKAYYPAEYTLAYFPMVFNRAGFILVNSDREDTGNSIVSYEYEIFKSNVQYMKGEVSISNITLPFRHLSKMMNGSCIWIKNLCYKDKNGIVHKKEIGEFKIEKVR
jgi:hypothetical protein